MCHVVKANPHVLHLRAFLLTRVLIHPPTPALQHGHNITQGNRTSYTAGVFITFYQVLIYQLLHASVTQCVGVSMTYWHGEAYTFNWTIYFIWWCIQDCLHAMCMVLNTFFSYGTVTHIRDSHPCRRTSCTYISSAHDWYRLQPHNCHNGASAMAPWSQLQGN